MEYDPDTRDPALLNTSGFRYSYIVREADDNPIRRHFNPLITIFLLSFLVKITIRPKTKRGMNANETI